MSTERDGSWDSIPTHDHQSAVAYGRLYMAIGALKEQRWDDARDHALAAADYLRRLGDE